MKKYIHNYSKKKSLFSKKHTLKMKYLSRLLIFREIIPSNWIISAQTLTRKKVEEQGEGNRSPIIGEIISPKRPSLFYRPSDRSCAHGIKKVAFNFLAGF